MLDDSLPVRCAATPAIQRHSANQAKRKENAVCQNAPHRHPIFCILTPQILASIARNRTQEQRTRAVQTLTTDHTFRSLRVALPPQPSLRKQLRSALAVEGQKQRTFYDCGKT
jgi:hypothetical protein